MKYYAKKDGCSTLRKIIADSDEEALEKAKKLFGTKYVTVGKSLQKAWSIEEDVTGKMLSEEAKRITKILLNV